MATQVIAFSGGVAPVYGAGQKSKFRHGGTWAAGDTWSVQVTSQLTGDFTIGKGNIAGKVFTAAINFKERAILGYEGGFAVSAIDDPTGWEEQNTGAANFPFSTQFGLIDTVYGFSTLSGRLYAFGNQTIQIWQTDADPTKWVLTQIMGNTGTGFPESMQSVGENDIFYVDYTGIRSIKIKELTNDAFVNDAGTPIDILVQPKVSSAISAENPIVATVSSLNKNYMAAIYDTIFVYGEYPISKISAWSRFDTKWTDVANAISGSGNFNGLGQSVISGLTIGVEYYWLKGTSTSTSLVNGTQTLLYQVIFTAQGTSVTVNGTAGQSVDDVLLPIRAAFVPTRVTSAATKTYWFGKDNYLYALPSTSNNDYTKALAETPWLEIGGGKMVQLEAIEIVCSGQWIIEYATNPITSTFATCAVTPFSASPTVDTSSTVGLRRFALSGNCSHAKFRFSCYEEGQIGSKLCSVSVVYKSSNEK